MSLTSTNNKTNDVVTFVACGDTLAHARLCNACYHDNAYDFTNVVDERLRHYILSHDLRFVNCESLIDDNDKRRVEFQGGERPRAMSPKFLAPRAFGRDIIARDNLFNIASCANNHACDAHEHGRVTTCSFFDTNNIMMSGINNRRVVRFTRNNITFAFIAFTCIMNDVMSNDDVSRDDVNIFDERRDIDEIREIAKTCDCVIVSMHWGIEYALGIATNEQSRIARALFDAGANIVIGHHPHVVERIERRDASHVVVYSLGNFVGAQHPAMVQKRIGLCTSFTIRKTNDDIAIDINERMLTYTTYDIIDDETIRNVVVKMINDVRDDELSNVETIARIYQKNYI